MKRISTEELASVLKQNADAKKVVDIGPGVEKVFNVSRTKFIAALELLRKEDYKIHILVKTQKGTDKKVEVKVLMAPGLSYKEVFDHEISPIEV